MGATGIVVIAEVVSAPWAGFTPNPCDVHVTAWLTLVAICHVLSARAIGCKARRALRTSVSVAGAALVSTAGAGFSNALVKGETGGSDALPEADCAAAAWLRDCHESGGAGAAGQLVLAGVVGVWGTGYNRHGDDFGSDGVEGAVSAVAVAGHGNWGEMEEGTGGGGGGGPYKPLITQSGCEGQRLGTGNQSRGECGRENHGSVVKRWNKEKQRAANEASCNHHFNPEICPVS